MKALAMDRQSVLVSWRPPKAPNGVITKYTVYVDKADHQVGATRLHEVSWLLVVVYSVEEERS